MAFKEGDRVWVELQIVDTSGDMMQVISDTNKKPYQTAVLGWAHASDLRYNAPSDLKQAIREVLLSDEFLTAFAAAWMKTPLIHVDEMNLTVEPITGTESEAYYLDKLKKGEAK